MTKTEMLNRLYQVKVSIRATLVLNYLINRSNSELTCFPAIKTIVKDCNMSARTVQRALNDLLEATLIEKDSRYRDNGGQSSNLYKLCLGLGDGLSGEDDKIKTENKNKSIKGHSDAANEEIELGEIRFEDQDEREIIKAGNRRVSDIKSPRRYKIPEKIMIQDSKENIYIFVMDRCHGVGVSLVPP